MYEWLNCCHPREVLSGVALLKFPFLNWTSWSVCSYVNMHEWLLPFPNGSFPTFLSKLFYCKCCSAASVVLLWVLSCFKYCPAVSIVLLQVWSCWKCFPTLLAVLLRVSSYSKCRPTASVVLLQVLFYHECCVYCECCPTIIVVLLPVLSWRSLLIFRSIGLKMAQKSTFEESVGQSSSV